MFIVNCKVLSKHVCFIFISDYICKYANNKRLEKEKSGRALQDVYRMKSLNMTLHCCHHESWPLGFVCTCALYFI